MHMATKTRRWVRADLEQLPNDGNRYEVLDGELFVTPQAAFRHQRIARRLMVALQAYCDLHSIGEVVGPGTVVLGDSELQPDVQIVPGLLAEGDYKWQELPLPSLVVEVLSDSSERRDLGKKREAYLRMNIPTYWVIDADQRRALVWTPASAEPITITDVIRWLPRASLPPLEISLETLVGPAGT